MRLDATQHHADLVALVEAADAEAADAGQADGEVAFVRLLEFLALRRGHHVEDQVAALLRRERGLVIGEILPLTFIAGGMPAVMNRSERAGAPSA
jgi:hypothetical protein